MLLNVYNAVVLNIVASSNTVNQGRYATIPIDISTQSNLARYHNVWTQMYYKTIYVAYRIFF